MQLWPVLLWPKPKAKKHTQYNSISKGKIINIQFATRTFTIPPYLLYVFIINISLLITTIRGSAVTQLPIGNYRGVRAADVVSAVTGLSNGYATANYMKNYYQVRENSEATEQQKQMLQQQQQQQYQNNALEATVKTAHQNGMGDAGIIHRTFMDLQSNNYENSVVAPGAAVQDDKDRGPLYKDAFSMYNGGFMPTTVTAAGQHYAASLVGLQTATDKNNALHHYTTTTANTANRNNLHVNHQAYGNGNNVIAEADNNKAQPSLFRRLSNYGGFDSGGGNTAAAATGVAEDPISAGNSDGGATGSGGAMQNYALTYADDAQQSLALQNFYNQQIQQPTLNVGHAEQDQTFTNYFPTSISTTATAGYEIENPEKYNPFNNYQQTEKPQQQYELRQQQYLQQPTYEQQQSSSKNMMPATYYQTFIQHKNDYDNKEHNHPHHRHVAGDNYHSWKQNQIMANYYAKESEIEKQQQHHTSIQEPETAETSHSSRIKKSPNKHKSKRHDAHEHNYNYDTLVEHNDVESGVEDLSSTQLQQIEQMQHQLHQQQQQFIELQHQLIDHDHQLQIQKQIAHIPPPTLPPISHTVHHSPHSIKALVGAPLSKHTQVIRSIPIPQLQKVHIPYRQNVTIEVPDPVVATVNMPMPIQIPVTRTIAVPNIQDLKIPIEKVKPFPVERPIPYIVEKRVPYAVEKQIAKPVYYPVPIKVPVVHTVIHKVHQPYSHYHHQQGYGQQPAHHYHHQQQSFHLPHTVYKGSYGHGNGHGHSHSHSYAGHGHAHHYLK